MATTTTKNAYYEGIGRRKTAVARVRLYPADATSFVVNDDLSLDEYFPTAKLQQIARQALDVVDISQGFTVSVHFHGGGQTAQAEALRHGIARALEEFDSELRQPLKQAGYLKRDPRMKERKKFGLKKARKSGEWSKR